MVLTPEQVKAKASPQRDVMVRVIERQMKWQVSLFFFPVLVGSWKRKAKEGREG